MDKKFTVYISEIVNGLDCVEAEKMDLQEEMGQHLQLLKKEYIKKGLSEKEAVDTAIRCFGKGTELKKGLNHSLFPYHKLFMTSTKILFGIYGFSVIWLLLVRKIIERLLHNTAYNPFIWTPNNYFYYSATNLVPFKMILNYLSSDYIPMSQAIELLFGNSLLFVPLGLFLPIVFRKYRNVIQVIKLTVIIGVVIELLQFVCRYGVMDIDEVILYTLGSTVGYTVFVSLKTLSKKWFKLPA